MHLLKPDSRWFAKKGATSLSVVWSHLHNSRFLTIRNWTQAPCEQLSGKLV